MPLTKVCTVCKIAKSLDNYYANRRSADKKGYRCKSCDDGARAKSRASSPGTQEGYRRRTLRSKYGMTVAQYRERLEKQGGCCSICKTKNPMGEGNSHTYKDYSFSVDHCHDTGNVRGLLCNPCNRGLGFFKDDIEVLERALNYLKESQK